MERPQHVYKAVGLENTDNVRSKSLFIWSYVVSFQHELLEILLAYWKDFEASKDNFSKLLEKFKVGCYSKCSKMSNTLLFLFSTKMLVILDGIHKMRVRIANREDPDQTASSEAV